MTPNNLGVSKEEHATVLNDLLNNRKLLYGYLQHLGMLVVDDTGREERYGEEMDYAGHGFMMLPAEIEHEDFFALEDAVRSKMPFTESELKAKLLETRAQNPDATVKDIPYASTPEQMRDMVDQLALDERFSLLFVKAEAISKARKEQPRAEAKAAQEEVAVDEELPTYQPQKRTSRW